MLSSQQTSYRFLAPALPPAPPSPPAGMPIPLKGRRIRKSTLLRMQTSKAVN